MDWNGTSPDRIARVVGILYIIGTLSGSLSAASITTILGGPDPLAAAADQPVRVHVGALAVLSMGVALAFIPLLVYPILRAQNEILALGYVVFRSALEMFGYLAIVAVWVVLVPLGETSIAATGDAATFQAVGTMLIEVEHALSAVVTVMFSIGAVLFNYLLYRSRIVPRWLSAWGLLAAVPYLITGLLTLAVLVQPFSPVLVGLSLPMAIQEMVLALWLVFKGFDSAAIESLVGQPAET